MAGTNNQIGLKASYGAIYMIVGNWTGIAFAFTTAYQEMTSLGTNFTLASSVQDFAMTTDGRLKYTGVTTKQFNVDANLSIVGTAGYAIKLYKNGVALAGSEAPFISSGKAIITRFNVSLSTNDYLSIYAKKNATSSSNILGLTLSCMSVGGF